MGWYELNDARAASINADTMIKIEKWNKEIYDTYMRERAGHMTAQKRLTDKSAKLAERKRAEREQKLRTSPDPGDVQKGEALNALLVDLSGPSVQYSAWRLAQVTLPEDLSIRELVFRFTPIFTDRRTQELSKGLIALGRLDLEGRWPIFLPEANVGAERRACEAAYLNVRDKSVAGALGLEDVRELDLAIERLLAKAGTAVPEYRGSRKAAVKYVEELKKATRMFEAETLSYAQEMIGDTQRHKAGTVGELLAFMRKYSLMFGAADLIENGGEKYARLYGLLQQQKEKLGVKVSDGPVLTTEQEWVPLFNGKNLFGWKPVLGWKVANGILIGSGPRGLLATSREDHTDFRLRLEAKFGNGENSGLFFRINERGLYEVNIGTVGNGPNKTGSLWVNDHGKWDNVTPMPNRIVPSDTWFTLEVSAKGNIISISIDGQMIAQYVDRANLHLVGGIAVQHQNPSGFVMFRKIEIIE